jgi:hypothetical protein
VFCATLSVFSLLKTLLHLMEFNPNFTYMLYSATAEDTVYNKYLHFSSRADFFTRHGPLIPFPDHLCSYDY